MINQYLLLLYQGSRCVYIHLTVQSTCIQQLNCVGITEETMAAVVYCHGIIYTLLLQSSWTVTKPAVFDEVFLPYNSILRPNRHFKVSSCSSSQLQFAYTVDLFQNMLKCKHLDSELLEFFFLFRWQSKQNQWKEREENGFSEAPWYHRIYSKYWCVHACFLKMELLRLRGRQWHKTVSTNSFSVCPYLNRDCPYWYHSNITVWGKLGSHPESLFNPGSLPLAAASSVFTFALWLSSRAVVLLFWKILPFCLSHQAVDLCLMRPVSLSWSRAAVC